MDIFVKLRETKMLSLKVNKQHYKPYSTIIVHRKKWMGILIKDWKSAIRAIKKIIWSLNYFFTQIYHHLEWKYFWYFPFNPIEMKSRKLYYFFHTIVSKFMQKMFVCLLKISHSKNLLTERINLFDPEENLKYKSFSYLVLVTYIVMNW